jgi:hypothetical protein
MSFGDWLCRVGYHNWSGTPADVDRLCTRCGEPLTDHEDI